MFFLAIFNVQFEYKIYLKIWKSKMADASDVIYMVMVAIKNQLDITWFKLIESTEKAHSMSQISS